MTLVLDGDWLRLLFVFSALLFGVVTMLVFRVFVVFYLLSPSASRKRVEKSCLYVGRVKHTRFHEKKHMLNYPLFLSCFDLDEAERIGWLLWPIFKVNATPLLPEFSTSIGGATSIDITKSGIDKAYGVERLATISGVPIKDMLFVGDSLFPGGNDTPARRTGITCIQVCGPDETECVIETVIACAGP